MTVTRRVNWCSRAQLWWRLSPHTLKGLLRRVVPLAVALALWTCPGHPLQADEVRKATIDSVAVSRAFFNPTLGQRIRITFSAVPGGVLSVLILDRDGYTVRALASRQVVQAGNVAYDWDGKDENGQVVPDEAYSLKIDLSAAGGTGSYFPANEVPREANAKTTFYDRQQGTLGYQLAGPARVHLQAGSSRLDPKTKEWVGPCLKTIVNREPRVTGSVIEHWDGYDESGTIYVPDLPNFAMSLFATALPENAILTIGNRQVSFLERASNRSGKPLLAARSAKGERHEGLNSFEDTAPRLTVRPDGATWSVDQRLWSVSGQRVDLEVSLKGPSARTFEREPGSVMVFLDDELLHTVEARPAPLTVSVRIPGGPGQTHRLTVNWVSAYGPVAANSIVLRRDRTAGVHVRAPSTAKAEFPALAPEPRGQP